MAGLLPNRRVILGGLMMAPLLPKLAHANPLADAFRGRGNDREPSYAAYDSLLQKYVKMGRDGVARVDYAAFKRSGHQTLKAAIADMEKVQPERLPRPAQFAFWANLYNAKTLDIVLDAYPVRSIKDISLGGGGFFKSGPWGAKVVTISGQRLSLDDIEHRIMRPIFRDPRVHYAVNCASISCPDLQPRAFTAGTLNTLLNKGARDYINHPRGVEVLRNGLKLSSIYKWYAEDFGRTPDLLVHLAGYADGPLQAALAKSPSIVDYSYDWGLNDAR